MLKFWNAIEWNDTVIIEDAEFNVLNSYGSFTNVYFINAYYGASGSTYFIATDGSNTILSKEDKRSKVVWAKSYSLQTYRHGIVMDNKEEFIYVAQEGAASMRILQINVTTGNLTKNIEQYELRL